MIGSRLRPLIYLKGATEERVTSMASDVHPAGDTARQAAPAG
jgi:hypothetical protein